MGEKIKHTGSELRERWTARMPRFFRRLVYLCTIIIATAFGVNTLLMQGGATPHQWWNDLYPLLLGVPGGMIIVCKLTVAGGYKELDPDNIVHDRTVLNHDIDDQLDGASPGDDIDSVS